MKYLIHALCLCMWLPLAAQEEAEPDKQLTEPIEVQEGTKIKGPKEEKPKDQTKAEKKAAKKAKKAEGTVTLTETTARTLPRYATDPVLDIFETQAEKPSKIHIPRNGSNIVDINSELEIRVNKESLRKVFFKTSGKSQDDLREELKKINAVLEQKIVYLKEVNKALASATSTKEDMQKFKDVTTTFLTTIDQDAFLGETYGDIVTRYFETVPNYRRADYSKNEFIFDELDALVIDLKKEYEIVSEENLFAFRLVAFMGNSKGGKQVHIENFDNYQGGEFYPVQRWVSSFSNEDIAEFERYAELAEEANRLLDDGLDRVKQILSETFPSIGCIEELVDMTKTTVENLPASVSADKDEIELLLKAQLALYRSLLSSMQTAINSQTQVTAQNLIFFNQLSAQILEQANDLASIQIDLDDLQSRFTTVSEFQQLFNKAETCIGLIEADKDKFSKAVNGFKQFLTSNKVYLSENLVAENVFEFSFDRIPPIGLIELQLTGQRKDRDKVYLKALVGKPDKNSDQLKDVTTVESRTLTMYRIGGYSTTKVHLAAAAPFDGEGLDLKNKFQFAPSASLLFKFGVRSKVWNNYFDFGWGINVGSTDMNLDGIPDISLGGVHTFFRDIVSIGINYNFAIDRPIYYFGVSLPFAIPGLPINTVKNRSDGLGN